MIKVKSINEVVALGGNVLIEVIESKKETDAGVALPDSAQEKDTLVVGEVLSLTTHYQQEMTTDEVKLLISFGLNIGDAIMCKKFDYTLVKTDDETKEYRMYNVNSIIGKLK